MSRRDPMADLDPTVKDLVGPKKGRRKKAREGVRYPSEETLERVRAAAKELGVAQYSLVEKLIVEGLDRWEDGELELRRVAVVTSWGIE